MEGKLERCRGLLGRKQQYWFKLDEIRGTFSYAKTHQTSRHWECIDAKPRKKEWIEVPLKEIDLRLAKVQQKSKQITIKPFYLEELVVLAPTEKEAQLWMTKIQSVIQALSEKSAEYTLPEEDYPLDEDEPLADYKHSPEPTDEPPIDKPIPKTKKSWRQVMYLGPDSTKKEQEDDDKYVKERKWKQFVVAIDFGTTYSGYAYQFIDDFKHNPIGGKTEVWHGGNLLSEKTPTSLLLTKDGKFHSFGYEAETKYMHLMENEEEAGWRFFKQFKMNLFQNDVLSREFQVKDDQGNAMPAEEVFGFAIEYLKNRAYKSISSSVPDIQEENIFYVVTVPAIWSDKSRQFMLEALSKAGIDADQAILAKEPEAAAIYCKERQLNIQEVNKRLSKAENDFKFEPGSKFIVLDLGGGTTDIAVNEVTEDKRLRMLRSATGGPWGGTNIDKEYVSLIQELIGDQDTFEELKQTHREEYLELIQNWELKKRNTTETKAGEESMGFTVTLPQVFIPKDGNREIQTSKGVVRLRGCKMRTSLSLVDALYASTARNITNHLLEITKDLADIKTIFMVGGLSSSSYIQSAVKTALSDKTIIIPQSPILAVLFGALIYGFCPEIIEKRISTFHYGIEDTGKFKVLISKGQEITIGERIAEHRMKLSSSEKGFQINIYAYDGNTPPKTVSECKKLGKITIRMMGKYGAMEKEVILAFLFEHTEMKVEATDAKTQRVFMTTCDFLG